jgi:hypothetical protein
MNGFKIELNEFVASALLITIAAVTVGYWQTHRPAEVIKEATVKVETQYIPAPAAKVNVRVIYPKLKPQTDMFIQPTPQDQLNLPPTQPLPQAQPRVWNNDNMLRASDPPTFEHRTPKITASLRDSQ